MKRIFLYNMIALVGMIGLLSCMDGKGYETISIGEQAPMTDHAMKAVSGGAKTIKHFKKKNGLVVIFTCNTCPFVKAWDDRYEPVHKAARKNDLGMVLLNPNEKKRDAGDGFADMKSFAQENHPGIPYLLDKESKMANAFGAKATPHVFLFDKDLKLVYKGAIDDNYKDVGKVKEEYLKNAIGSLAQGKEIEPQETKAIGCSIKRVE